MPVPSETLDQPTHVLVVDDDASLRGLVDDFLTSYGYIVHTADGGTAMLPILNTRPIDVVILDVMMPGEDGLSLARMLSARSDIAVIMVSALGSEADRIIGLEVGADDYLPKPVSPRELLARMRAVLRRKRASGPVAFPGGIYMFDGWRCDVHRRISYDPGDVVVTLSQGEFHLLRIMLERPQRVLTRDQLLELSHNNEESDAFDRAIDTQVSRLRRKLSSRSPGELIRTVRNEGYMFTAKVFCR